MQIQLYPIVYSGISDDDIRSFISGNPLPLTCADPLYVSFDATEQIFKASEVSTTWGSNQFIVIDNNTIYYGWEEHPWTKKFNLLDIYTDYGFKHWGSTLTSIVGDSTNSRLVDYETRTVGNRVFLLALSNGLPTLLSFSKETYLLNTDVRKYYLLDRAVDFFQWITTPDGKIKILVKHENTIMFVDLPTGSGYTMLGTPVNVGSSFGDATDRGGYDYANYINPTTSLGYDSFKKVEFYYHGNTLCAYISYAGSTTFWHQDVDGKFIKDLTLPYGSYFTYYSAYNNALNMVTWDSSFIGDYRWYVITPMSDLYTYFYNFDLSKLFRFWGFHADELIPAEFNMGFRAYPISIKQSGNRVSIVFNGYSVSSGGYYRIVYFTFEQPIISTALVNVNLGIPYTSLKGSFTIFGELFSEDFAWETASKSAYRYLKGVPSVSMQEYTSVNLRVTPKLPQYISSIVYEAPEHASDDVIVTRIDDRNLEFIIPYILFEEFNILDLHIRQGIPVAPFIRLVVGGDAARHCIHNAGTMCMRSREEYKTASCNSICPLFSMDRIRFDISHNGNNVVGSIEDEREIFPPLTDLAHVEISMEY